MAGEGATRGWLRGADVTGASADGGGCAPRVPTKIGQAEGGYSGTRDRAGVGARGWGCMRPLAPLAGRSLALCHRLVKCAG